MWISDLEGDGLKFEIKRVHCIVNYDIDRDWWHVSVQGYWKRRVIQAGILPKNCTLHRNHVDHLRLMMEENLCYHNGYNFDYPALRKLYPWWTCNKQLEDTFILSSLFNPDRRPPLGSSMPHSIEAYGLRFGIEKPAHYEWRYFSIEMLHRCIEDVKIGTMTWYYLQKEKDKIENDWSQSIRLEYATATYHAQQEMNGFPFNKKEAIKLLTKLTKEIDDVSNKLLSSLPKQCKELYSVPVKKPFKKNGDYSSAVKDFYPDEDERRRVNIRGPFTRIHFVDMNLNSDMQVKDYLLSVGWVPTTWNYKKDQSGRIVYDDKRKPIKTSPKLTEDSYYTIDGDLPKLLARRNILCHRRNLISNVKDPENKGLLSFIRSDGRVPAEGVPQAAVTGRYRHRKIVNIPTPGTLYGTELRSLFYVPASMPDHYIIGTDADGLEARMEAHYCYPFEGGKEYAYELLNGDVHINNALLFELINQQEYEIYTQYGDCDVETIPELLQATYKKAKKGRKNSKPGKYGLSYGCKEEKLSSTLKCDATTAKRLWNQFWDGNTALKGLRDYLETLYDSRGGVNGGYLIGLDGRILRIRKKHALVNTMFQSGGNIVVKTATCLMFNKLVPKYNLSSKLICHQHDEFQALVHERDVEQHIKLASHAFESAGRYYNLNVPITATSKVGKNWAETH